MGELDDKISAQRAEMRQMVIVAYSAMREALDLEGVSEETHVTLDRLEAFTALLGEQLYDSFQESADTAAELTEKFKGIKDSLDRIEAT